MVPGLPRPPNDKHNRRCIRTLEELWAAPPAPDPEALLAERAALVREFGRRMLTPLRDLLREEGA